MTQAEATAVRSDHSSCMFLEKACWPFAVGSRDPKCVFSPRPVTFSKCHGQTLRLLVQNKCANAHFLQVFDPK